jgi:predicted nucleic acid-binding protein
VVDASAVVRGLLVDGGQAAEFVDEVAGAALGAHAPDLLVAEVTNALCVHVSAERWPMEEAQERLATFLALPVGLQPSGPIASEALEVAAARGLSVYDALYVVLAAALDVPLVTADRRLADASPGSLLVA